MPYRRSYRGYGGKFARMGTYRRANFAARRRVGSRFRRRSIFRTGGNYNQVLALPRSLAMSQGPEKKYHDTSSLAATTLWTVGASSMVTNATTSQLALLNNMQLGTSGVQRIGRQVTIKSLYLRIGANAASTGSAGILRLLCVWDTQANGAVFAGGDLFEDANANGIIVSPLNMSNRERFRVVMDKTYNLGGQGAVDGVGPDTIHIEKFKKMNTVVTYNGGNAGTIADIATNALYLVFVSTVFTAAPLTSVYARIRFTDA